MKKQKLIMIDGPSISSPAKEWREYLVRLEEKAKTHEVDFLIARAKKTLEKKEAAERKDQEEN